MDIIPKALYNHVFKKPEIMLVWQITNQLQNYDGCSDCSLRANRTPVLLFSKEVVK